MVAGKGARKALARALSHVVLSRETILVHAESVLGRPDLVQGSLHSAAFDLWFAVLQRAEAEDAVERVVGSVLEDNPGADPLRQALLDWQRATAPGPTTGELAPDSLAESPSSAAPARVQGSERARWVALGAMMLAFVALFVARAWREPESRGHAPGVAPVSAVRPPVAAPTVAAPPAARVTAAAAARAQPGSPVQVGAALRVRPLPRHSLLSESDAGAELELREEEGSAGGQVQKRGR